MYAMTASVAPGAVSFDAPALVQSDESDARELTGLEIDYVSGGIIPFLISAGVRCAASTACRVGVLAAAGAVATLVGYENNRV